MELGTEGETETFLIEENQPIYSLNQSARGSIGRKFGQESIASPANARNSTNFSPYYAQSVLSQAELNKPRASVIFNKKRQLQPPKPQPKTEILKFNLTKMEQLRIIGYNLIEPLLVAVLISTSLQIVELPSTFYLLISFAFMFATLLTDSVSRIQTKRVLAALMVCLAPTFSLLKFWVFYQFTPCPNFENIQWLKPLFGVFPGRWIHTFICDFIIIPVSAILVLHYSNQIEQLKAKCAHQGSLKYQDKIKILHFVFGERQQVFFATAIVLFFIDSLIYLTVVQLIILIILMQILYKWTFMQLIHKKTQEYTLRAIQIITYLFLTISYYFQYAIVLTNYQEKNQNLFRVFGLQNEDPKSPYHTRQIVHKIVLSFAIVISETYFVCKRIFDEKPTLKKEQTDFVIVAEEKVTEVKATIGELIFSLRIPLVLWLCRILCFITVYMYHDWQSVILLVWLFHSTVFQNKATFVKLTAQLYFPLMILIFLFMFTVNIYGLIDYQLWAVTPYIVFTANTQVTNTKFPPLVVIPKTVNMYRYGFYQFNEPHIELTFNLVFLVAVAYYIRLNQSLQRSCEPSMLILRNLSPLLCDWVTLAIIKSEEVIIAYVIVFSLSAMDIYHNLVLFWYVWGVLYPQKMAKTVLYVSYYAAFFLLVKYIYTLVPQFDGHSAECFTIQKSYLCDNTERVMYTIGFDSYYNPLTFREYFRYIPPYFDWIFVVSAFVQLRRQQTIGTDKAIINKLIADSTQNIAEKMPRFYSFYVFYESIYYMVVTIGSFITFLVILTLIERNILNLVSFQLILLLLLVYLMKGTTTLYKYYRWLPFYQAFVLVSLIICQFVTQCVNIYPSVTNWLHNLSVKDKLIFQFIGYYQYPDAASIWLLFIPYIVLFFGTCVVYSEIGSKVGYEADELKLPEEPKDHLFRNSGEVASSAVTIQTNELNEQEYHQYSIEVEKVYFNMKYQNSFKIWKLRFFWSTFTAISLYFDVLMNVVILAFAIYYSISFIWLVFLIIYALQTWLMQVNHRTYRKQVISNFLSSVEGNEQIYTNSMEEARQIKLHNLSNLKTKQAEQLVQNMIERLQEQPNGAERLIVTDQQAHIQYTEFNDNIHKVTLSKRKFSWFVNYILLFFTFFFLYLAMFIDVPQSLQVISSEQQSKILFIFYFLGFYKQTIESDLLSNKRQFFDSEYPFFILLLLLTLERVTHLWLDNKCNTTKEKTDKYQLIQDAYETCQKRKQKVLDRKENQKSEKNGPADRSSKQVEETEQVKFDGRSTFDPNSFEVSQNRKDIQAELNQLLSIKSKIRFDAACRILMEEIIVLLCLMSLIYKQNILSFVIYFVVLFYTFKRFTSRKAISLCKYTILFVFVVQYALTVFNMSSYSTSNWPTKILVNNVYPNQNYYYFNIPICFTVSSNYTTIEAQELKTVNLRNLSFYSIDLNSQSVNGLWIDFMVTVLIYFYLNAFNFWLVATPHKIVLSERTQELIESYKLETMIDQTQSWRVVYAELKGEVLFNKILVQLTETISLNFSLLLVTFILMINVFQTNLLSFGYLISALVLIYMNISFFKDIQGQDAQIRVLRYFLLPYLLFDIFIQLLATLPIQNIPEWSVWISTIGIARVWTFSPTTVYLGEDIAVQDILSPEIGYLFLKAIAYFFISLQLWLVQSVSFQNFSLKLMIGNLENQNKIGLGMAYRFNNFKNKQIMKQAENYEALDKMLKHVKSLIKRRDKLYKIDSSVQQAVKHAEEQPLELLDDVNQMPIIDLPIEDQIETRQARIDYQELFKSGVKKEFQARMRALSIGHKIYMWLRRNYVQDLLFRFSDAHLADMIKQFAKGRTCIKTTLEVGIMVETKQDWLKAKLDEMEQKLQLGEVSEDEFDNYKIFRRKTLESMSLKPWERFDKDNFKSFKHLISLYLVLFWKMISSHSHLFCYFFMLLATIQNGGLIYMPYPALLFGRALLEEDRPGKIFWYIVINYTNFILLIQFTAQLSLWQSQFQVTGKEIMNSLNSINFGLIYIPLQDYNNFWQMLWWFIPEIGITVSTLLLIQKETLTGLFDVQLNDYESFADGLQRQAKIIMEHSEQAKQNYHNLEVIQTTREKLQFDQSLTRKRFLSEWDLREQTDRVKEEKYLALNSRESSGDIQSSLLRYPIEVDFNSLRKRSKSLAAYVPSQTQTQKPVIQKLISATKKVTDALWDNKYFDRLFPKIKQQKPGKDFYVGIAGVQVIICFYLVIFYNQMTAIQTSLAEEYASTQFKGNMVLALFVMIGIMVVDRILYSNQSFMSRKAVSQKLDIDAPLISNDNSSDDKSTRSGEKSARQKSFAGQSDLESERDFKDITETEQRAFQDILTPQYREKTFSVVIRFYFLWLVLILVHWYLFFALVNEPKSCKTVPFCNKFSENGYLVALYILFCIYFALSAGQIRTGLPELRKGGFMLGQYNPFGQYIFEAWYEIPFLFELRTIIDWTFTSTALDVFQSIKLAQIQSDLYVARCMNKVYMQHDLGAKQPKIKKIAIGFSLLVLILVLIAGPMLLFSTLNPVSSPNPVTGGYLEFYIEVKDTSSTSVQIPIFSTRELVQNQTLSEYAYNQMDLGNLNYDTSLYYYYQNQAVQFSPVSDTVWMVSPPKKAFLSQALIDARDGTNPDQQVTAYFIATFQRPSLSTQPAQFIFDYQLNSTTTDVLDTLIVQTSDCNAAASVNTTFPATSIQITLGLNAESYASYVTPQPGQPDYNGYFQSGFTLFFDCNPTSPSDSYWNLTQTYNSAYLNGTDAATIYNQEIQIFNQTGGSVGFGFFVFNQNVLPNYLAKYASSVLVFYAGVIYLIASQFRAAFVPFSYQIFITDAPYTEDILSICQCIYIYRVQRSHKNEEELYMILIDIMRSPEMIKSLSGSSLKKKLD